LLAFVGDGLAVVAEVPVVSNDYLLRQWDMDEGLPQSSISDIAQTPDGYLWIGTVDGLVRFDGVHFKVYRSFEEANPFIADVRCLSVNADGSLWAGFERAAVVRERNDEFKLMAPPGDYTTNHIFALAENEPGSIWAGYAQGQLGHWHSDHWETMDLNPTNKAARFRDNISCCTDSEHRIWFASEWLVGYLDGGSPVLLRQNLQEFSHLTPRRKGGVWLAGGGLLRIANTNGIGDVVANLSELGLGASGDIQTLMEDRKGAVWIGTKGNGLFRFFEGQAERVPTSHNYIRALCEDREGNLWVGTGGGGLDRLRLRNLRLYDRSNLLPKDLILSLCETTDGSLWLAPREATPVQLARNRQEIVASSKSQQFPSGVTLCADHAGGVWLGSFDRGVFHLVGNRVEAIGLEKKQIDTILEDSHGTLWVGTLNDGLFSVRNGQISHYPTTNGLQQISALAEDSSGSVWVGTFAGGLYHQTDHGFISPAVMPGASVLTILADGTNRLWIGTRGGGLLYFNSGKIQQVTHQQGLADDDIRQILMDDEGDLWIGSAHGLFQVSRRELAAVINGQSPRLECDVYGRNEGLGSIEFSEGFRNTACRTADGKLWFATSRGAVEVDPKRHFFSPLPPQVHIEEFLVDGQPVPLEQQRPVIVPAGTRSVELRYTGLSFTSPENIRFRHRLENVESEWLEAGPERTAKYLRLPPGKYRFEVTARGGGGVWQAEGAKVNFVVLPTLWQNIYFRVLLTVLFLALATLVTRTFMLRRMRARMLALEQAQALSNERRRIARDMHDELGASLTRIDLMGDQALQDPRLDSHALQQVGRITQAVREVVQTLDQVVWTVNPVNDRLDRVVNYLSRFVEEFLAPTKIQFRLELPESVPPIKMSSQVRHELLLAVKEALNNAVKHSGAGEIALNIIFENNVLNIILTDNGRGFDPAQKASTGDGLDNLDQRLRLIGGRCQVESTVGRGSMVRITLPMPLLKPL